MTESMITLGCIMADVSENESGEIISTTEGDVKLTFCFTSESVDNMIIVTPQMRQLGDAGYLPIAIARIDSNDPTQFFLRAVRGLSEGLRVALEHQGCNLIRGAFARLTDRQDGAAVSN
ncbi:MAG: hypothetical protein ABSB50_18910 [Terracidiphilus sp.]|jgi:hypothetical protein